MLSILAFLFTVVAYANAQTYDRSPTIWPKYDDDTTMAPPKYYPECGNGGILQGTNCVCDTSRGYICGNSDSKYGGDVYFGCAAEASCACGSSSSNRDMYTTPCTSFTTFPSSLYNDDYNWLSDYRCINTNTGVQGNDTYHTCNVPKQSDRPATYNSDCADRCRSWTCLERDGNTPNFCSGSCYDANDQCMTKWGIPSMSPTASPTASSPIEALQAAVAVQSTYLIVLIVGIVVAMICSCLACAAAFFSYRKNTDNGQTDTQADQAPTFGFSPQGTKKDRAKNPLSGNPN